MYMAGFFQKIFGQSQPKKSSEIPTEPIDYEKSIQPVVVAKPKKYPMDPPQLVVG